MNYFIEVRTISQCNCVMQIILWLRNDVRSEIKHWNVILMRGSFNFDAIKAGVEGQQHWMGRAAEQFWNETLRFDLSGDRNIQCNSINNSVCVIEGNYEGIDSNEWKCEGMKVNKTKKRLKVIISVARKPSHKRSNESSIQRRKQSDASIALWSMFPPQIELLVLIFSTVMEIRAWEQETSR